MRLFFINSITNTSTVLDKDPCRIETTSLEDSEQKHDRRSQYRNINKLGGCRREKTNQEVAEQKQQVEGGRTETTIQEMAEQKQQIGGRKTEPTQQVVAEQKQQIRRLQNRNNKSG
ncbi:Hypothetical predicted protein [Mytilus galloprovincialis]|uniref:Uncharacterized protein n=1 Tax=Mytilus galloprovincialis TaxID=29158 RepID=A0A8B6BTA9_MYTGA|nr:Hypothetical predicted protein [Mytilus galloprovincialis]